MKTAAIRSVNSPAIVAIALMLAACSTPPSPQPASQKYGSYQPSTFSSNQPPVLVNWYSPEGKKRLARSGDTEDFYQLAHFFQPQINPLYCGIASSVIVLNALRIPQGEAPSQFELEIRRPQVWGGGTGPFPTYSQISFLNQRTDSIKPSNVIRLENITPENTGDASAFDPGLTLAQLKGILEVYETEVQLNYADLDPETGAAKFRMQLIDSMKDSDSFVILNFRGNTLGATTGGHISPVAAYDTASDSLLLLDVAGHKNPWYWVPVKHMYQAMHTKDGNHYRGWMVVRDKPGQQMN